jgi:putative nucleotidyltransferase with HDIG domain
VPLPLRPALGERAPDGGAEVPALTGAERSALAVIAEHVRDRARLQQVWVFAQPLDSNARVAIEEVARTGASGPARIPDAAARAIALSALRSGPARLGRPAVTFEDGVHVVSAETSAGRAVLIIACAPGGARVEGEGASALVELAEIGARVLSPAGHSPPTEAGVRERAGVAAYGSGLADALTQLRRPPVLAESRVRLEHALEQRFAARGAAIRAIETDMGLALAIIAAANDLPSRPRAGYASIPAALDVLGPHAVLRIARGLPTLRPLDTADRLGATLQRLLPHAVATRAAADLIARHLGEPARDDLRLFATLHDLGKVTLATASPDYLRTLATAISTPEERLADERRRLGIDHAAVGAVAARRLGLPRSLVAAIERHHAEDAGGPVAIVRLADMVAHQAHGEPVAATSVAAAARRLRIGHEDLQRLAYDLARTREPQDASAEPSPLSPTQEKVLVGLAASKTYKQIAADLGISESTVRTHLHNLYGKLEVRDRAQAVLLASERGWI